MKVLAYYPLHYGAEFLEASIQSIYSQVEKIIILYSPTPSFGFHTDNRCPESEQQLKDIALKFDKVQWITMSAGDEHQHRSAIWQHAEGYDLLLAVDADEVWLPESLKESLETAYNGEFGRYNILGFIHFWKSPSYIVADSFAPGRIYNLKNDRSKETAIWGKVYHFGYCQSQEIIDYKMSIHGHRSEIRREWRDLYINWTPESKDLHPTSYGVWPQAMPFDKNQLPEILKNHPNFNKEVI